MHVLVYVVTLSHETLYTKFWEQNFTAFKFAKNY
jgi:hypothetical protein